jgi:hypothetical protein
MINIKFALYCVFHLFSYESKLDDAAKYGVKKGFGTGVGMGCFQLVNYINYALSFW